MTVIDIVAGYGLAITLLFAVLIVRCKSLSAETDYLKEANQLLNEHVKELEAQYSRSFKNVLVSPDAQKLTRLSIQLLHKQEEVDDLKDKIRKQNALLKQKWQVSKNVQN